MAGPVSIVFLSFTPSAKELNDIQAIIRQSSTTIEGENFWVNTTLPIGGITIAAAIEARPFAFTLESVGADEIPTAAELAQIETTFQYKPAVSLVLIAMRGRPIDHRLLGEITLYFAEKFNAPIYFDGPLNETHRSGIPGKIQDIIAEDDGQAVYSVCDTVFMRNWLCSPHFQMIKQ